MDTGSSSRYDAISWICPTIPANFDAALSGDGGLSWGEDIDLDDSPGDVHSGEFVFNATYCNLIAVWLTDDLGWDTLHVSGFRPQTLIPTGWAAGPTAVGFELEHFDPGPDPMVWTLMSFSPGGAILPGDGRMLGLTADSLLRASILLSAHPGGFASTAIAPDGSGQTAPLPAFLPAGIELFAVGLGFDPVQGTFGNLTDVVRISL